MISLVIALISKQFVVNWSFMKTVLITGTSKGLGHALLETFLNNRWMVFALARDTKSFTGLKLKFPDTCIPIQSDITDSECTKLINDTIETKTKTLDLLINNAGNAELNFGFDNVLPEHLENHFKVHVSGAFRVIKACFSYLSNSVNPIIVNISSRKGSISKINQGAYRILLPY